MFNLKDKVIYPGYGVAVIDEIIEKEVSNLKIRFFKLNFIYKDMTILIPVSKLEASSIRLPYCEKKIDQVLEELNKVPPKVDCVDFTPSVWNRRNKNYQARIQSGRLEDLIVIYRDLMYLSQRKELSFGEKNLLQNAEDLIVQEIMLVKNKEYEYVAQELQTPIKQIFFAPDIQTQQFSSAA